MTAIYHMSTINHSLTSFDFQKHKKNVSARIEQNWPVYKLTKCKEPKAMNVMKYIFQFEKLLRFLVIWTCWLLLQKEMMYHSGLLEWICGSESTCTKKKYINSDVRLAFDYGKRENIMYYSLRVGWSNIK